MKFHLIEPQTLYIPSNPIENHPSEYVEFDANQSLLDTLINGLVGTPCLDTNLYELLECLKQVPDAEIYITGSRVRRLLLTEKFEREGDLDILVLTQGSFDPFAWLNLRFILKNGVPVAAKPDLGKEVDLTFSRNHLSECYHFGSTSLAYNYKMHSFVYPAKEVKHVINPSEPGLLKREETDRGYSYDAVFAMLWRLVKGYYIEVEEACHLFAALRGKYFAADRPVSFQRKIRNLLFDKFEEKEGAKAALFLTCAYFRLEKLHEEIKDFHLEFEELKGAFLVILQDYQEFHHPLEKVSKRLLLNPEASKELLGDFFEKTPVSEESFSKRLWDPMFDLDIPKEPRRYPLGLDIGFKFKGRAYFIPAFPVSAIKKLWEEYEQTADTESLSKKALSNASLRAKVIDSFLDFPLSEEKAYRLLLAMQEWKLKPSLYQKLWNRFLAILPSDSPFLKKALKRASVQKAKRQALQVSDASLSHQVIKRSPKLSQKEIKAFLAQEGLSPDDALFLLEKDQEVHLDDLKKHLPLILETPELLERGSVLLNRHKELISQVMGENLLLKWLENEDYPLLNSLPDEALSGKERFKTKLLSLFIEKATSNFVNFPLLRTLEALLFRSDFNREQTQRIIEVMAVTFLWEDCSEKWIHLGLKRGGVPKNLFLEAFNDGLVSFMEEENVRCPFFLEVAERIFECSPSYYVKCIEREKATPDLLKGVLKHRQTHPEHPLKIFQSLERKHQIMFVGVFEKELKQTPKLVGEILCATGKNDWEAFPKILEIADRDSILTLPQGKLSLFFVLLSVKKVVSQEAFKASLDPRVRAPFFISCLELAKDYIEENEEEVFQKVSGISFTPHEAQRIWAALPSGMQAERVGKAVVCNSCVPDLIASYLLMRLDHDKPEAFLREVQAMPKIWVDAKGKVIKKLMEVPHSRFLKVALWIEENIVEGAASPAELFHLAKSNKKVYLKLRANSHFHSDPVFILLRSIHEEKQLCNLPLLKRPIQSEFLEEFEKRIVNVEILKNGEVMRFIKGFFASQREAHPEWTGRLFTKLMTLFSSVIQIQLPQNILIFLDLCLQEAVERNKVPGRLKSEELDAVLKFNLNHCKGVTKKDPMEVLAPICFQMPSDWRKEDVLPRLVYPIKTLVSLKEKSVEIFKNGFLKDRKTRLSMANEIVYGGGKGMLFDRMKALACLLALEPITVFLEHVKKLASQPYVSSHEEFLMTFSRLYSEEFKVRFQSEKDYATCVAFRDWAIKNREGILESIVVQFEIQLIPLIFQGLLSLKIPEKRVAELLSAQTPYMVSLMNLSYRVFPERMFMEMDPIYHLQNMACELDKVGVVSCWTYLDLCLSEKLELGEVEPIRRDMLMLSIAETLVIDGNYHDFSVVFEDLFKRRFSDYPPAQVRLMGIKAMGGIRWAAAGIDPEKVKEYFPSQETLDAFEIALRENIGHYPVEFFTNFQWHIFFYQQFFRKASDLSNLHKHFIKNLPDFDLKDQKRNSPPRNLCDSMALSISNTCRRDESNVKFLLPLLKEIQSHALQKDPRDLSYLFGLLLQVCNSFKLLTDSELKQCLNEFESVHMDALVRRNLFEHGIAKFMELVNISKYPNKKKILKLNRNVHA